MSTPNETFVNTRIRDLLDAAKAIVQCKHDKEQAYATGHSVCMGCGAVSKFGDALEISEPVRRLAAAWIAAESLPMRDILPDTIASLDDVKGFATGVSRLALTRGLDCVVAVSAPGIGWYVQGVPGFAALGLAHQAVCSMQKFVDGTGSGPEWLRISPPEGSVQ